MLHKETLVSPNKKILFFVVHIYHFVSRKIFCALPRRGCVAALCDSLHYREDDYQLECAVLWPSYVDIHLEALGLCAPQEELLALGSVSVMWQVRSSPGRSPPARSATHLSSGHRRNKSPSAPPAGGRR